MKLKKKVAFHTLGCKLNFAETSTIIRELDSNEFEIVTFKDKADIYVINTCLVTSTAEKKCHYAIRKAHKTNPEAKVAVIGCYSELKPQKLSAIEGVSVILDNDNKFNLNEYLKNELADTLKKDNEQNSTIKKLRKIDTFHPSYSINDRTRSFLKVQDGCDYFCSYCAIPFARGRSRSGLIKDVISNARSIALEGVKEIILTGINIGDFGKHNNENLLQLIKQLDEVEGIERYRISSIEPELLHDEIIKFIVNSKKFLPHFHIPLQSGSDKILKLMHRKYDTEFFSGKIKKIKTLIPDCLVAADVIIGFPSESDEDFKNTFDFIKNSGISYCHIFPFSPRENTNALKIKPTINSSIIKNRCKELQILSDKLKLNFYKSNKGLNRKVLFESNNNSGFMYGFTDNYLQVKTLYNPDKINEILNVKLNQLDEKECCYIL